MPDEQFVPEHIQKILNAFDFLDGPLPRQAFLEAREHRDEIIPELLKVFQNEIDTPEDQREFRSWLSTIALYLLVEFRAKETLPMVLESLHYSEKAIEDIYSDVLTEDIAGILYHLGVEPDTLDSMIRDEKLYWYVRWEALHCFYYFVRDKRMTEEELIDRFQVWLQGMIESGDHKMVTSLVCELASCGAESALPVIEQAYEKGLVDTFLAGRLDDFHKPYWNNKPSIERNFERLEDYADAFEAMSKWVCFQPKKAEPAKQAPLPRESKTVGSALYPYAFEDRPKPKIGRNDPCPCGSGKKYKKCCLK